MYIGRGSDTRRSSVHRSCFMQRAWWVQLTAHRELCVIASEKIAPKLHVIGFYKTVFSNIVFSQTFVFLNRFFQNIFFPNSGFPKRIFSMLARSVMQRPIEEKSVLHGKLCFHHIGFPKPSFSQIEAGPLPRF